MSPARMEAILSRGDELIYVVCRTTYVHMGMIVMYCCKYCVLQHKNYAASIKLSRSPRVLLSSQAGHINFVKLQMMICCG